MFTLALIAAILAAAAAIFDAAEVRRIDLAASEFQSRAANVITITAANAVDGRRCDDLTQVQSVQGAAALQETEASGLGSMPGATIPTYLATEGFVEVFGIDHVDGVGVFFSEELSSVAGVAVGDTVTVRTSEGALVETRVAGVYSYPSDGRQPGLGFAMVIPTPTDRLYDTCAARVWPMSAENEQLLWLSTNPTDPTAGPPEVRQLNASLGVSMDAAGAFRGRWTAWLPAVVAVTSAAMGFALMRRRKLEFAMARHLGVTRIDQLAVQLLALSIAGMPIAALCAAVGLVDASLYASSGESVGAFLRALLPGFGALLGVLVGGALALASIRSRGILDYLQTR